MKVNINITSKELKTMLKNQNIQYSKAEFNNLIAWLKDHLENELDYELNYLLTDGLKIWKMWE